MRRARLQCTIQVYTPPGAWPFSTWAVLAIMWHLAPEGTPTGTAEEIAGKLHTWSADQDFPWRRPRGGLPVAPAGEGFSLAATLQRHPDKAAPPFGQTGTVLAGPPDSGWRWDAEEAQPLPDPWIPPLWSLPPPPRRPGTTLLRSLQAGAAWVLWQDNGRPVPYFPLVQGQALLHTENMGTVEWGAFVPDTACRWVTAAVSHPMPSPPACHRLLQTVPPLAPRHAVTREVPRALLSHHRNWIVWEVIPGARYPPEPVLKQLTAPTAGVRHVLHRASAPTAELTNEVLDLGLEPLPVLYPQAHIPPAGTSNPLARLGLQHRVEATHTGGVVEQWLALHNPSTTQGHWYLHQLLFLLRAAPEHRQHNPYDTHPEHLGAQSFPQPGLPALPQGQDQEALLQGSPLHATTAVQQRGSSKADGAEPDRTNCGMVACTASCGHPARDTTGVRPYRPADQTALASTVTAVTVGPMATWPSRLLPHIPCQDAPPRQPAATHKPTARLMAEQLYAFAAAPLADCGESFVHQGGPAQIAGSIQGPQRNAPHSWRATLPECTPIRDTGGRAPPPGLQQGEALVIATAGYQAILHGHTGGYRSHILAEGKWTVWHGTAR